MSTMLTPSRHSPEARGKRWLHAKVQAIRAASPVVLAPPHAEGTPVCYGGPGPATGTTLSVLLADDPEPKALLFRQTMIADCGAGLSFSQHHAILLLHRTLKKMGIVPA